MKLAPVYQAFAKYQTAIVEQMIINTGQHYDAELSADFVRELDLPSPDYNLNVHTKTQAEFIGKSMVEIDHILSRHKTNLVIVYGDTNSTLAGALVAAKSNIPLAHVEAGLREFNMRLPEEVNKRAVDAISDLLFAPSKIALDQLRSEHVAGDAHFVGDVTFDLIKQLQSQIDKAFTTVKAQYNLQDDYILATCHRAINTDNPTNLESILDGLAKCGRQVIFPIHPRTAKAIDKNKLSHYLDSDQLTSLGPLPYLETQALLKNCSHCITDSGGLIKEAYFHSVPAIIIDTQTEWIEAVESGLHTITGPDTEQILTAIKESKKPTINKKTYGVGDASTLIAKTSIDHLKRNSTAV